MGRLWMMLGCVFGGLTVAIGAFAAHGLKDVITPEEMVIFEVATRYMTTHAFALLALGLWSHFERWSASFWSGLFFVLGIVLFSGSLYTMAFVSFPGLVYATPVGGFFLLLGWIMFLLSIFRTRSRFL